MEVAEIFKKVTKFWR